MLRRILGFTFALLLFALAFSIPDRTTAPSDLISGKSESPGLIVAALFLPQTAIAQATASAPGQTVADTSARSAPADQSGRSHALLWGTLALVAVLIAGAWFATKRSRNGASGGGYASGSTSGPSSRPQRPSAT